MNRFAQAEVGTKWSCVSHPHQHGHGETKPLCFYLKGLMPLRPTCSVSGRERHRSSLWPTPNRDLERSRAFPGVSRAMTTQFGSIAWADMAMETAGIGGDPSVPPIRRRLPLQLDGFYALPETDYVAALELPPERRPAHYRVLS